MSLCKSIDTLAMAYLDDELASEERRELELHLGECSNCKTQVEAERSELSHLRAVLVAPPASDFLRSKLSRALDAEDKVIAQQSRRQWSRYLLPGGSIAVAAAALLVFVSVGLKQPSPQANAGVPREAARQTARQLPLEVQGASTGPWMRKHFAPVEPPQFKGPNIELIGGRATAIAGHDAVLLRYLVNVGVNRVSLTTVLIAGLQTSELPEGTQVRIGNLVLHAYDAGGQPAVTYIDENNIGYVFTSERMSLDELTSLVGSSDLIARSQSQVGR